MTQEMYLIGNTNEDSIFTFKEILDKLLDISNLDKKSIKIQTSKEYVRPTSVPFLIGDMSKFMKKLIGSQKLT